jgi:hypothetical protein
MSARDQLDSYIEQLEGRLRVGALARGAAILGAAALAATVVLVLITNAFAFSHGSLISARVALFLALAYAVGFGFVLPLYQLNRHRAASKAEAVFPQFQQRLVTFAERNAENRDPFIELLAADTLELTRKTEPANLVPNGKLLASLAASAVSLSVLIWMIVSGPGYLGHGASLLWAGSSRGAAPFYDLRVHPGDVVVRRNTNQVVTAQLIGLQTDKVRLYARYQSASKWEQVTMQPQPGASGYQFLFAGLPEGVEYYIAAGPLRSRHFNIRVVDLPAVKQIRVTYRFPAWTGLKNVVEERGGDLRAVEGTDAELEVLTDRPLRDGVLVLDDQKELGLSGGGGNLYQGTIRIEKDGSYHLAALDQGQRVRLSDDFFIEARKANPPEVRITRPGRDYRSSPIEEVTVSVQADGEFGLSDVSLHYSVNGGSEQIVKLLKQKGVKQADGSTTLYLEDFKLVPGDLVSLYGTAKDARSESRTDMFFIQADPFEREFSQSQQAGGAGGAGMGGGGQSEISQREKEIIAATWKQQGDKKATQQMAAEAAKFLAGVQAKLRDQALSLAGRLERRELTEQNEEFSHFQEDMNAAAQAMGPASEKLQQQKWTEALPGEQKALQHLLRAEATFRQIEVAFGSRGGGGGGGGAGRDLESLFDLELDTEKNQYETAQTAASANQRTQEIDEALQKLDQLAKRQQELAEQQRNSNQSFQQRWQQEMLRREAEQLQQQMEQLARSNQQGAANQQGSSGSTGQSSASTASTSQPRSGRSQGTGDPRVQQALDRLRQANEDMRRAASPETSEADARRAADRLREATDLLGGARQQAASQRLESLGREADRLGGEQRDQATRMRQMFGQQSKVNPLGQSQPGTSGQEQGKLADDRGRLADEMARLEKEMQDAARELAARQGAASSRLREALGEMQAAELQSRIQRSAESIRRGMDPNSNSSEPAIAAGIERLGEQVRQAQRALSGEQQGPEETLNRVERLRSQMEALARNLGNRNARSGQQVQRGQPGQQAQGGQQGTQGAATQGGQQGGNPSDGISDGYRGGGYVRGGRFYRGFDTGGYIETPGPERQPSQVSQAEIERAFQDALRELNDLRQTVRGQPEPLADIQELIREMQRLDPSRFPGNPALVEQLHTQVLTSVDKLELQLRRTLDDKQSSQVRGGDSLRVPPGYQESVAEYFRRLSKDR